METALLTATATINPPHAARRGRREIFSINRLCSPARGGVLPRLHCRGYNTFIGTAAPFWGTSYAWNLTGLSPKRNCSYKKKYFQAARANERVAPQKNSHSKTRNFVLHIYILCWQRKRDINSHIWRRSVPIYIYGEETTTYSKKQRKNPLKKTYLVRTTRTA